jgi:hypothetical protein
MRRRLRGLVRRSGICLAAIVPFLLLSAGSATAPAGAASRHVSRASVGECPGKPGTGTLSVTVTIEPGHPPPVINITGPGFKATINKSQTFCVAPGVYTVVGQPLRLPPDGGNPEGSTLYATVTGSPAVVLSRSGHAGQRQLRRAGAGDDEGAVERRRHPAHHVDLGRRERDRVLVAAGEPEERAAAR